MGSAKPKIFIVENESIVTFDIECCLKNNSYDVVGRATSHLELMKKVIDFEEKYKNNKNKR